MKAEGLQRRGQQLGATSCDRSSSSISSRYHALRLVLFMIGHRSPPLLTGSNKGTSPDKGINNTLGSTVYNDPARLQYTGQEIALTQFLMELVMEFVYIQSSRRPQSSSVCTLSPTTAEDLASQSNPKKHCNHFGIICNPLTTTSSCYPQSESDHSALPLRQYQTFFSQVSPTTRPSDPFKARPNGQVGWGAPQYHYLRR